MCGAPADPFGDHALSCHGCGIYRRHNLVRDCLFHLSREAGWAPELEVAPPNSTQRPADVLLTTKGVHPVAVDFSVCHPLRPSHTITQECKPDVFADAVESAKIVKYEALCPQVGWSFIPFGIESAGGLGCRARKLLRQLTTQISMTSGRQVPDVASEVSARVSTALAKGRALMLLASLPPLSDSAAPLLVPCPPSHSLQDLESVDTVSTYLEDPISFATPQDVVLPVTLGSDNSFPISTVAPAQQGETPALLSKNDDDSAMSF